VTCVFMKAPMNPPTNLAPIMTDFTMLSDEGSTIHSNNKGASEFVMLGQDLECSSPLSSQEKELFKRRASRFSKEDADPSDSGAFVLISPGRFEASAEPLSPTDRKLYFRRQSHSSPRIAPIAAEFPSDEWRELPAPLND